MFKYILYIISYIFVFINIADANNYIEKTIYGHKIKLVKYDTKSDDFIFKVGVRDNYKATNLRTIMEESNGISAINGAYFCPSSYKECWGFDFTANERYVDYQKKGTEQTTGNRVVFALDKENKPFLYQSNKINPDSEVNIKTGIANFPLLLQDGKDATDYYVQAGLIDSKMKLKMSRNFVCSDKEKNYIYFGYVYNIEMLKLPEFLLKIGCYDALNLDAGGSSAMIYNSKYIIGPGRDILDSIIIERKGLDTKVLRGYTTKAIKSFELKNKLLTFDQKIHILDKLDLAIGKKKSSIYDKNSIDLYDETGKKIGYEINTNSIKTLSNLYILNYLEKLIYELKNKYIAEYNILKEQQRIEESMQNLLF